MPSCPRGKSSPWAPFHVPQSGIYAYIRYICILVNTKNHCSDSKRGLKRGDERLLMRYLNLARSLGKCRPHPLIHTPLEISAQDVEKKKAEPRTPHFLSLNQDIVAWSQEAKCRLKYEM